MHKKSDYDALETEFITGEWNTLSKFCQDKGLQYGTIRKHAKGWRDKQAAHRNTISSAVKDADVRGKVLDAERKAEYLSGVLAGMLNQWKDMQDEYSKIKTSLASKEFVANRAGRARVMGVMRQLERGMGEINKSLELLAGRPTSREVTVEEEQKADDLIRRFGRLGQEKKN